MTITKFCPDCSKVWATIESSMLTPTFTDKPGLSTLTICCPDCHKKRRARLAELNTMYPSAEELGLLGSITEIPTERFRWPHQSGRQINHKSEHRAG